ncbi:DUF3368 domain-containing protein [Marivirga sp.]|uniref:DUF3368 domain-containing protein n=1 Tax=Marivirga sp. TaxID=2018662 RepID=UPI002D7FFA23|nr:DUF3368 domain-containing protein [Marivirga sp.]HET8861224.1 DUF3368 domain-containing protein [Marivirga sp.]
MQKTIVSDTSCLILFSKIDRLELLKNLFSEILITDIVAQEFNKPLPRWIKIQNPKSNLHLGLFNILDIGEATAISLATDFKKSLIILDEQKGRKIAKDLGLDVPGSLGMFLLAKQKGLISSVKSVINQILGTNFRFLSP